MLFITHILLLKMDVHKSQTCKFLIVHVWMSRNRSIRSQSKLVKYGPLDSGCQWLSASEATEKPFSVFVEITGESSIYTGFSE